MSGVLALLKALLPFIKEIYRSDDDLRPVDRKRKFLVFLLLLSAVFIGFMGTLYRDHISIINDSEVKVLRAQLQTAEQFKGELEKRLRDERNYTERIKLNLDRTSAELEQKQNDLNAVRKRLFDLKQNCYVLETGSVYDRLKELEKD